ncbi:MAG: hypothetical protein J0L75_18110 [Spirochaetes bacterium]|nr:hypothetical protein [Spirochaetota bacterium]
MAGPRQIHRALFGHVAAFRFHSNHEARFSRLYAEDPHWDGDLAAFFAGFDWAVFVSADPDGCLTRRLERPDRPCPMFLHAPFPPFANQTPVRGRPPISKHHETLLVRLGCPVALLPSCASGDGSLFLVQPGSGSPKKNWPAARFREVMETHRQLPWRVLLGPAEEGLRTEFKGFDLVMDRSLEEVRGLLVRNPFYLGNDSGISQWAGYLGCRGVLIVPRKNLWFHDPPWPGMTILETSDPSISPGVDEVSEAIRTYGMN